MYRLACGALAALCMFAAAVACAAPPLEDYGKLPAVEQMLLSPNGQKLAYIAVEGAARVLVVRKTSGEVLFKVGAGNLKIRDLDWLGDDHILLVTTQTIPMGADYDSSQRFEMAQSTIVDATSGKLSNVFRIEPKIYHATFGNYGYARKDGREYGYFAGLTLSGNGSAMRDFDTNAAYLSSAIIDLYQVDLQTGKAQKVAGGIQKRESEWVVSRDGVVVAHTEFTLNDSQWRLYADPADAYLMDRATDPTQDVGVLGQGRTPGTVLVNKADDDGEWSIVEFHASAAPTHATLFDDTPMSGLLYDRLTGLLIGGVTTADDPKTILFDPAQQAKFDKVVRAFPSERITLISNAANLDQMVVRTEGPGDSGTYFLIDLTAKKAEAIGWNYPTILQDNVAATRVVTYKAADGLEMQGVLTLPLGREAKNLPIVVMPHGGPEARDYLGFDWWAQAFAARGYAVFQPNFRGSSDFGKAFRDAGHGQWGRKMQTDISDGLAELVRQGIADPKRACIVGGSYGGYAALAGVTVQQGIYRCAVSVAGVSDLVAMLSWTDSRSGATSPTVRYWRLFMGADAKGGPPLKAFSPAKLADQADAPILLIHGKDDTVVPISQSWMMRDALNGAHKPVEMLELSGEDHWLTSQTTRVQMLTAAAAFVEKNNPAN